MTVDEEGGHMHSGYVHKLCRQRVLALNPSLPLDC